MIYFSADYGDRDSLLRLGAEWDFDFWRWRIPTEDAGRFSKWLGRGIIALDKLFIAEGVALCPVCGKRVRVAAPAVGRYMQDFAGKVYGDNEYRFISGLENIDGGIADILRRNFPVRKRYVEGYGYRYLSNGCPSCDAPFSDAYLSGENSPFCADTPEKAAALIFYRIYEDRDTVIGGVAGRACERSLIEKYARFYGADGLE